MVNTEEFDIEGITPSQTSESLFLTEDVNGLISLSSALIQNASRQVAIYSPELDINLFANTAIVDACSAFARSDRHATLRILVNNSRPLLEISHPLIRLQQRLSDKIQLRCLPKDFDPENIHHLNRTFIVADDTGLMVQHTPESWRGFVNFDEKPKAKEFEQHFSFLWRHSEAIIELQRLGL